MSYREPDPDAAAAQAREAEEEVAAEQVFKKAVHGGGLLLRVYNSRSRATHLPTAEVAAEQVFKKAVHGGGLLLRVYNSRSRATHLLAATALYVLAAIFALAPSDGSIHFGFALLACALVGLVIAVPTAVVAHVVLVSRHKQPRFANVLAFCLCGASLPSSLVMAFVFTAAHGLGHM